MSEPATVPQDIYTSRRAKLEGLRANGIDPYPHAFDTTHTVGQLVEAHGSTIQPGGHSGEVVRVAGRVMGRRDHGNVTFLDLLEQGIEMQLMIRHGQDDVDLVAGMLDLGDWVGVTGEVVRSLRGELSVQVAQLAVIAKTLRPMPDRRHGLADVEQRYRQRELDLTVNADSRRVFQIRSRVIRALRAVLDARGFAEVETPLLHPIPGGAAARPFNTHHNALDATMYLRIAPELYLKRLIVGGMGPVFEIGRNFRNEGLSRRHNPEFTMLEAYDPYRDHEDGLDLVENLIREAAIAAQGTTTVTFGGRQVHLGRPFRRVPMLDLVQDATGNHSLSYDMPRASWVGIARDHGIETHPTHGVGRIVAEIYEALVEASLWEPTFVTEHPVETSPLAKRHRALPHVTERYELICTGRELANGFSELTDPDDQRARFEEQAHARDLGDHEAMHIDEPYLRAMEHGLPPTSGLGIGVDRLVMLIADAPSIRDVILFPTLRPEVP